MFKEERDHEIGQIDKLNTDFKKFDIIFKYMDDTEIDFT